ncbi:forkhead box protein P1 isoform X3 [Neocloeon triangulifer]|uniref:forkhead box protein P1 isoform X3 n=1 Tax=Neocloeon triangulifer TaxID=2078957 RepID=UPI00286F5FD9|nr:forkhead box protein P1 isoform X3 [Neocloeon triangulifer]
MLEPRWRPVQGNCLGEGPLEVSPWTKSQFSTQPLAWPPILREGRRREDGIMDHDNDGAINLSTSQRPSACTTPNGSPDFDDADQASSLAKALKAQQQQTGSQPQQSQPQAAAPAPAAQAPSTPNQNPQQAASGSSPVPGGGNEPKSIKVATPATPDSNGKSPPPLSASHQQPPSLQQMMSPGLQQMQQVLQQHILSPAQLQSLQQAILLSQGQQQQQQFAELGRKQLEQVLQQLQEQLQLNLIQQSHLLQSGDKKKASVPLQQLSMQQQQLMQQLRIVQHQFIMQQGLVQPMMVAQGAGDALGLSPEGPWKEAPSSKSPDHEHPKSSPLNGLLGHRGGPREGMNGITPEAAAASTLEKHPLYGHGVCKWPGCETICEDADAFFNHLNTEHILDDRSTAQARVQMQVVSQLELQLQKERDRLQAMMQHLHMTKQQMANEAKNEMPRSVVYYQNPSPGSLAKLHLSSSVVATNLSQPQVPPQQQPVSVAPPMLPLVSAARSPMLHPPTPTMGGPIRRRISDKSSLSLAGGLPYMLERAGLDVQQDFESMVLFLEIQRNREFYKNADVRPPFTYASLIRQSIIESPDKQLTLNEIYNWFQNTFCYFRRNAATWKNAVRHNLSLHKCFMRVENVKGAVWTVDEVEFYKRRPQRCSTGGVQSKSPTMTQSPTLYGDALNASLQFYHENYSEAALADSNLPFLNSGMNRAPTSSPDKGPSPPVELRSSMDSVHIKQEPSHLLGSQMLSENGMLGGAASLSHLIKHEMLEHGGHHGGQHPMEDSGDDMDGHDGYKEDERKAAPSLGMSEDEEEDEDVAQDLSMAPESEEHSNQG